MNLWIRNSDKDILIEANNFFVNGNNEIVSFTNIGNGRMTSILGKYKTKERALEVLDEIQDIIISTSIIPLENNDAITCGCEKVYEMPKE